MNHKLHMKKKKKNELNTSTKDAHWSWVFKQKYKVAKKKQHIIVYDR